MKAICNTEDKILLGGIDTSAMMYVDDEVILAKSREELQEKLKIKERINTAMGCDVNVEKTEVMVFYDKRRYQQEVKKLLVVREQKIQQ